MAFALDLAAKDLGKNIKNILIYKKIKGQTSLDPNLAAENILNKLLATDIWPSSSMKFPH